MSHLSTTYYGQSSIVAQELPPQSIADAPPALQADQLSAHLGKRGRRSLLLLRQQLADRLVDDLVDDLVDGLLDVLVRQRRHLAELMRLPAGHPDLRERRR